MVLNFNTGTSFQKDAANREGNFSFFDTHQKVYIQLPTSAVDVQLAKRSKRNANVMVNVLS